LRVGHISIARRYNHLGDRLAVAGQADVPKLADLIRCRGQPA
jgi:hypothetical protein